MIFPENKKLLTATNWSLVCIPEAATVWQRWCGGGIGDLGNNQQWDAGVPGDCWAFRHIFWLCLTSGICLELCGFYFWNNQQWERRFPWNSWASVKFFFGCVWDFEQLSVQWDANYQRIDWSFVKVFWFVLNDLQLFSDPDPLLCDLHSCDQAEHLSKMERAARRMRRITGVNLSSLIWNGAVLMLVTRTVAIDFTRSEDSLGNLDIYEVCLHTSTGHKGCLLTNLLRGRNQQKNISCITT